jgi:hypothetical protein
MKILLSILFVLFLDAFLSVRRSSSKSQNRLRSILLSCLLTVIVTVQLFFFMKPPEVNYFKIGWLGQIQYLNREFQRRGISHQIPLPDGN